jgi:hypothetical protein
LFCFGADVILSSPTVIIFTDTHSSNDATAASKLINLLKSSDNVSNVILKHHINSGFVTYSSQGKDEEKKLVSLDSNSKHEVEMWRKELVCDDESSEILVFCAWCHDHEKRKCSLNTLPSTQPLASTGNVVHCF